MNIQIIAKELKQQPLLKFSAFLIGYSIWFFFSKNENVILELPINIATSKPESGKIIVKDEYFAELEINRIQAMDLLKINEQLKLFFDIDNLKTGEHKLKTETALIVTHFQPKIIKHNLPNIVDCLIY